MIVAEGYTDVLMLHQAGLRNTVGLMGTAMTPEQVAELARLAPTVLLALDADSAGQEAMIRAERLARARKLAVRVVPLPAGSDPAELVQSRGRRGRGRARGGCDPVRALPRREGAGGGRRVDRGGQGRGDRRAAPRVRADALPPSALREDLIREVAEPAGPGALDGLLVAGRGRAAAGAGAGRCRRPGRRAVRARRAPDAPEREFLALCIALPTAGAEALRAVDPERDFSSPLLRRAHAHLLGHLAAPADGIADDDAELRALIAELVITAGAEDAGERQLRALRVQLELRGVERQLDHAPPGQKAGLARRRLELQGELARAMQA